MATTAEELPMPDATPDGPRAVASRLGSLGGQLSGLAGQVPTAAPASWKGFASTFYSQSVSSAGSALRAGAAPMSVAAAAVGRLATVVADVREQIEELDKAVATKREEAEDKERRAQEAHEAAVRERERSAARSSVSTLTGMTSSLGTMPDAAAQRAMEEAESARREADRARGEHEKLLQTNKAKAQDGCDQVRDTDRSTAIAVRVAAIAAPASGSFVPGVVTANAPVWYAAGNEQSPPVDATYDYFTHLFRRPDGKRYVASEGLPGGSGWGPTYAQYDPITNTVHYVRYHRHNDFRNLGGALEWLADYGGVTGPIADQVQKVSVHGGDFEGLSVRLDGEGAANEVVYRVHKQEEWYRKDAEDVSRPDGGQRRIIGHVTEGGHSTYHDDDAPARGGVIPEKFGDVRHDAREDLAMLGGQPYAGDEGLQFGSSLPNGSHGVDEPMHRVPGNEFMDKLDDQPGK